MTLAELNGHFDVREKLLRAEEMLENLREAACPGASVPTGMPHATGFRDKVGDLAAEIADMDVRIEYLEEEVRKSESHILDFIRTIDDDQTRLIFRLRFIRCLTWREVAQVIGGRNTEDSVKMVCYRYLGSA